MTDNSDILDADIGILTHLYLQVIAENGIKNWSIERIKPLISAMERWFKQKGYNATDVTQGAARVNKLLQNTLASEQGLWVLQNRESAASELAIEAKEQQEVSRKIIDRTFIDNGTRWIIDYKSVALANDTSDIALKTIAEQYQTQLNAYALLFANEGLPIQKAIFFVSLGKLIKL